MGDFFNLKVPLRKTVYFSFLKKEIRNETTTTTDANCNLDHNTVCEHQTGMPGKM